MSYKKTLEAEIKKRTEELATMNPDSAEYAAVVDSITKLMDRLNEIKARRAKNGIEIGTAAASVCVTVWWALTSLKFEENGSITTSIGRKTLDMIHKLKK